MFRTAVFFSVSVCPDPLLPLSSEDAAAEAKEQKNHPIVVVVVVVVVVAARIHLGIPHASPSR
jgi:hypothetical protein